MNIIINISTIDLKSETNIFTDAETSTA